MPEVEFNKDGPQRPVPPVVMPEDKDVEDKTYHTRFPGSRFIMPDGEELNFNGAGHLTTKRLNVQRELNMIADRGGSPIFTKEKPVMLPSDTAPVSDIKKRAEQVLEQLKLQQQSQTGG